MSKREFIVLAASKNPTVSDRNTARGSLRRVIKRFAGNGDLYDVKFLRYRHGRSVYRYTYGWGTNDLAWFDACDLGDRKISSLVSRKFAKRNRK